MIFLCLVAVINGVLPKLLTDYINNSVKDISIEVELGNGWVLLMVSTAMSLFGCGLNIVFYIFLFKKANWDRRNLDSDVEKKTINKKRLPILFMVTALVVAIVAVFAPKFVIKEKPGTLDGAKRGLTNEIFSFMGVKRASENLMHDCFPPTLVTLFKDAWFRRKYNMVDPIKRSQ